MKKFLLAIALLSASAPALAQNTQCSNRPNGDDTNACANTRFVQAAIAGFSSGITIGTTVITGGTNTRILYDNSGVVGEYPIGTGIATFLATPSSANLRATLTDETGTGAAVFAGGDIGAATATTAAAGTNTTQVATTAFVRTAQTVPAFSVTKGGTNQTGIVDSTFTQLTWSTEVYDVGGYFASDAWTPPAGKVTMSAGYFTTGPTAAGSATGISIYKNGAAFKSSTTFSGVNQGSGFIQFEDIANGTDAYTVWAYIDTTGATATIVGLTANTFFLGHWDSP